MNSELNKIAGGVISALLVIFGSQAVIEMSSSSHGEHEVVGYELPKPDAGGEGGGSGGHGGEAAEAPAAFDAAKVAEMVASADAAAGEKLTKKCKACHTFDNGGANKVGPHLWGVYERAKGGVDGFGYSDALKGKGGNWDAESLVHFLHKPKEFIPGTKMVFAGFKDNKDLADIVAYLETLK